MKENSYIEKILDFSKNLDISSIKKFIVYYEMSSTNNVAKQLASKGEEEGTVVIARKQTKGKGRFDRKWDSPEGGVYLSIILRPSCQPDKATLLSLSTAVAISKTISNYNLCPKLKWPNDVRVNGKKIAGILLGSEVSDDKLNYVVLGVGINLNIKINSLSKNIRRNSTTMLEEIGSQIDYYSFIKNLLLNLDKYYKLFRDKKYTLIIKEWKKHSDTIGRMVEIITPSRRIIGEAYDINESGSLIIMKDSGKKITISSGDCTYYEN